MTAAKRCVKAANQHLQKSLFKCFPLQVLRLNQTLINEETSQLESQRRLLALEKREFEKAKKAMLQQAVISGNNNSNDRDASEPTWDVGDGPTWSHGDATYTVATAVTVNNPSCSRDPSPTVIGPRYASPGSRNNSRPNSRSHSKHRAEKAVSPVRVAMRDRGLSGSARPRSANLSPQRWTVVSPTGTMSRSPPSQTVKAKVKSKARSGSISPSAAMG